MHHLGTVALLALATSGTSVAAIKWTVSATASIDGEVSDTALPKSDRPHVSAKSGKRSSDSTEYKLIQSYDATNFFDNFDFFTEADPDGGYVDYVDGEAAMFYEYAGYSEDAIYLGADHATINPKNGRMSTRLTSKKAFSKGLIIADIAHMPYGAGVWPAFWTFGPYWPHSGEIDIIEGVNLDNKSQVSLHTGPNCIVTNTGTVDSTSLVTPDCRSGSGGGHGCAQLTKAPFGAAFNAVGGGVYAVDWTADYIAIYWFPRDSIPQDITAEKPDPKEWGAPLARFNGGETCDIDEIFVENNIVFNTDFCGDWAGSVWQYDVRLTSLTPTCQEYVGANPEVFTDAYWLINSVKVYDEIIPTPRVTPSSKDLAESLLKSLPSGTPMDYELIRTYDDTNFFDNFEFFTGPDPTQGYVEYTDAYVAQSKHLAGYSNGGVFLGADHTTVNPQKGRMSTRVTSHEAFTKGLFIADIAHMPAGPGVWPSFWTFGPNWPNSGAIDIIEGVNLDRHVQSSLHTGPNCVITNTGSARGTFLVDPDCDSNGKNGCAQRTKAPFGAAFNTAKGGVFAMDWTADHIAIYWFPRNAIPEDITAEKPNPATWGLPVARFNGGEGCDIDSAFVNNNIVFNTAFCGVWAGSVWKYDPALTSLAPTCEEYVGTNPEIFFEAYWLINSLKVYSPVTPKVSRSFTA
ncbi:hypothetical protein BROUX41_006137 [Berkeleyomyces rouxiae]|uniref:uncharacterized protein n=1 Tax=Berkeleyomyces rouxiae TaxID=2035830 RepID=UPI003B7DDBB3